MLNGPGRAVRGEDAPAPGAQPAEVGPPDGGPPGEAVALHDQFYILATESRLDERTRVLKHGETFAIFDPRGDVQPVGMGEQGLYHEGTRFLSRLELRLDGARPLLLGSAMREDNTLLTVDLTNPDFRDPDALEVPHGTLHFLRSTFLWQGVCYHRLRVRNYGLRPVELALGYRFDADFADIFEVRGMRRERRGRRRPDEVEPSRVTLAYEGLDGVVRRTRLEAVPEPARTSGREMLFRTRIEPHAEGLLGLTIACGSSADGGARHAEPVGFEPALLQAERAMVADRARVCEVFTTNEQFNDWTNRSIADLHLMVTQTPRGPYPFAGVPWFSTVFGRDGIITALECLWAYPQLARGVLAYLAATQASEAVPERDSEPGKILHETRRGEMAALGEVPFGLYYGSVDATPLFVVLAAAYYRRTGDRAFLESIWDNVERALAWMEGPGDADGDGFVEYFRHSPEGLVQQGWKDSQDSVFHADGCLAQGPIALCEVQGYVYAARRGAAEVAAELGRPERAGELLRQARALQERFSRAFWDEELATFVLALDGEKRPCRVRASNAGHCLYAGVADPDQARGLAATLLAERSFSGWGVRTLAEGEARYNPMSYHNGSVWPHDNALVAAGLAAYGQKEAAARILAGLLDASLFVELRRMPELFCGFLRRRGEGPTLYPVACAPQAWAAGAVFLLLQSCLGLSIDAPGGQVLFSRPFLPRFLQQVRIRELRVGTSVLDLLLQGREEDVSVSVLRRAGDVEVVVVK